MTGLPEAQEVPRRRGGRRVAMVFVIVVVIVAILGVALWLADGLIRGIAQDSVEDVLESKLPGDVEAELDVAIGGGLFLPQAISGEFSEVTVTTEDAVANGIPFDLVATAHGVPLDENAAIDHVSAVVSGGEDAANALLVLGGADPDLSLGDGTLSYEQSTSILGMTVGYTLVTEPEAHGDSVTLTPVDVEVASSFGNLDLTGLVNRLLGGEPLSVCVASSLPEGISVDAIDVTSREVALTLSADDVPRSGPDLASRGTCDAG
ncbi:LmeA family phospholipid-binding protein [Paramicrobacterium agarici]|uniref:LmeA family phospholipid-binding protein n=1 Tax=Paramicrobacterium agarici TaxID=630514 RepID=UPI00114DECD4|nr:DUF2993 domain-containing protein [Microbacterium agarici]TQO23983.1 DUF2993 family protein [Microbacterium agarici]